MLISSISGIRGTIGGKPGENLTPMDIVSFVSAYGSWILSKNKSQPITVVVGRDARKSGSMIMGITINTLVGLGINVINLDLATTPTVAMSVISHKAQGGIIITASHNPKEYNGLKMLNEQGEFLSQKDGDEVLDIATRADYSYVEVDALGTTKQSYNHTVEHINAILALDLVDVELVKSKKYTVCVDAINSVGGIAVPMLLEKLGVTPVGLYCDPSGEFEHAPEPLEENLGELKALVTKTNADLGIAVDPDADRLVLVDNTGAMFGEEYTIITIADYVLSQTTGNAVSNLSSSRGLMNLALKYKVEYTPSAVGEKNVVEKMKEVNAVIGGEGSGGVTYPELHYGRDALVGIALFLTSLAKKDISSHELRKQFTNYFMTKEKVTLDNRDKVASILNHITESYSNEKVTTIDGVRIDFEDSWVHVRASNTEPVLRIISEAPTQEEAKKLAEKFKEIVSEF